jgi:uncharacterized MAPEG superfamily protein
MTGITALLLFTAWTLALMLFYVGYRVVLTLTFRKAPNSWPRDGADADPPIIKRAHHAHLNCVENLPVFAAIVLAASALGKQGVVDTLAAYVLVLRVAQSRGHLSGTRPAQVFVRANLFLLQAALMGWMIWGLTR